MPLGGKAKALRRLIWSFTRDPDTGLPSATLSANGQWHPRLLMATKEHVAALLDGVNSEVGRIGYVAVTRARNLLWLGVPANALKELQPALLASGFREMIP